MTDSELNLNEMLKIRREKLKELIDKGKKSVFSRKI